MMAGMTAGESISFDPVAKIYDATRGGLERGIRFAATMAPYCDSGPIFEIGVGTGAIAKPLRDRIGQAVLGVDISAAMLEPAHQRLGARVAVADVAQLPVPDACVGTVVAAWVLHLVGDPAGALHEVARVLRPGGRLLVISAKGETEPDDLEEVLVDLHEVLRGRVDVRERLEPLAAVCGLALVDEIVTEPGTWQESPNDLVERMERRQWGVLIDLDSQRYQRFVQPVVDGLRALPDPDRPRTRIGRNRMFVFTHA